MTLDVVQVALGLVFAWSAWSKLRAPRRFAAVVRGYAILPGSAAGAFAWLAMAAEAVLAVALLVGVATGAAAAASALLLASFLVAVGIVLRRGADVSCGCFGADDERVSRATAARLVVLAAAAAALGVAVLAGAHEPLTLAWVVDHGANGAERAVVAAALAAAVLVLVTIAASARSLAALWRAQRPGASTGAAAPVAGSRA